MGTLKSFAVVIPSRGLVHSRTIEAVLANVDDAAVWGYAFAGWRMTHALPIPDCDEVAAEMGMETGADAIWYVEEDVIPPVGALVASFGVLDEGADIAAVDYPVGAAKDAWGCLVRGSDGRVLWCGLGATLIRRTVFETLRQPWFSTDYVYVRHGGALEWSAMPANTDPSRRYGQQDIHFCMTARAAGLRIEQVPGMVAGHAKVEEYGQQGTNVGYHTVSIRTVIARQYPG